MHGFHKRVYYQQTSYPFWKPHGIERGLFNMIETFIFSFAFSYYIYNYASHNTEQ
jgi:hypothetical protein